MKTVLTLVSLLLGPLTPVQASGTLAKEISCYRSVAPKSNKPDYFSGRNISSVLVPSEESSKKGFYLYSDKSVLFCSLPGQPSTSTAQSNSYYLQVDDNGNPLYFAYVEDKRTSTRPPSVVFLKPPKGNEETLTYVKPACKSELTDKTRRLLHEDLANRVRSVKDGYVEDLEAAVALHRKGGVSRQEYIDAINGCSGIPEIQTVVNQAVHDFPPGSSRATIQNTKSQRTIDAD